MRVAPSFALLGMSAADHNDESDAKQGRERGRRVRRSSRPPRRRTRPGQSPGVPVVDPTASPPRVRAVAYGPAGTAEIDPEAVLREGGVSPDFPVTWVHVQGLGDRELLARIAAAVQMHPLALEDVVHAHQRPKLEAYDEHMFMVVRAPGSDGLHESRQVAVYASGSSLVSFEERPSSLFDPIFERIRRGTGRIRRDGTDYLAYAILDAVIDAYFPVVEQAGDLLDELEADTTQAAKESTLARVYELKRDVAILRRVVAPHRDVANRLARGEFEVVDEETRVFFRDCHDHAVQLLDQFEQLREVAIGLMELHVSLVGNRMNDVMRVLTVIATIFIPLTFVVGLYGMNFDPNSSPFNMPELRWRYGYPTVLGMMVTLGVTMYLWFRRRGWLGGPRRPWE
ncbi:MAG: magnesium/cobalt transporter CorA [Planctomycetota bacterium]